MLIYTNARPAIMLMLKLTRKCCSAGSKDYPIRIFVWRKLEFGNRFSDGANYAKTQMILARFILPRVIGSVGMAFGACFLSTFKCFLFGIPSTLTFFEFDDKG